MRVMLTTCGNPNRGENPDEPLYNVDDGEAFVDSLEEASKVCREWIDGFELGAGNWSGGDVYENGIKVARISYNGRIWPVEGL